MAPSLRRRHMSPFPRRLPGAGDGGRRLFTVLPLLLLLLSCAATSHGAPTNSDYNIVDFGAVPDGETDAAKALAAAWDAACGGADGGAVLVPSGAFLVGPLKLQGPCRGPMVVRVEGVVKAPVDLAVFDDDHWISFESVDGFVLTGGGVFDGQGASAWRRGGCARSPDGCKDLPKSVRLRMVNRGTVQGISSVNSKFFHILILESQNIELRNLIISAPGDSPNTDGVHIARSAGVTVADSVIGTGDDCVSVGPGSADVDISGIRCGPGHGISVGSLGKYPGEEGVTGVTVRRCTISDAKNGVRIKTWRSSVESAASGITFEDIVVTNTSHPVIIDQDYCPHRSCDGDQPPSQVSISNVRFSNIRGSSTSVTAVSLVCSSAKPCRDVELQDIDLRYVDGKRATTSECSNIDQEITFTGKMNPAACA